MEALFAGIHFTIETDHQSLKFLLNQKIGTLMQQIWVYKLLDYDFLMKYKQGKKNVAVDGLRRRHEEGKVTLLTLTLTFVP